MILAPMAHSQQSAATHRKAPITLGVAVAKTTDRMTRRMTRINLKDPIVKVKFGSSAPHNLTFYSLPRMLKVAFRW